MHQDPTLDQSLEAYRAARAASADTTTIARLALDSYAREAIHQGHSTRDIAKVLQIPKSTIHRIQLGVGTSLPAPSATLEGYVAAHKAAWAASPEQQIDRALFEVYIDEDGMRRCAISGTIAGAVAPHTRDGRE